MKVTVFAVGAWISRHTDVGHRIVSAGHELGNHTMNHKAMGSLGSAELSAEIDGGARALIPFIGSIGRWFRPSGITIPTPAILAAAGTAGYDDSIGYDVDTLDYQDPGASAVLANVARELRPGSIVSMHFGHRGTIEATPPIIELLASRGLRAVTLSDLLA